MRDNDTIRTHSFVITLFNHESVDELRTFFATMPKSMDFWIAGNEKTEKDKQHWQCAVHFKHPQRFNSMKDRCGKQSAHVEVQKGTWADQKRYCTKQDPNPQFMLDENGEPMPWPRQGERGDLHNAGKCKSLREHIESDEWNFQSIQCLTAVLAYQRPKHRKVTLLVFTEKEFELPDEETDAFVYSRETKWHNYDGESILVIYSNNLPDNLSDVIKGRPCKVLAGGWARSRAVCVETVVLVATDGERLSYFKMKYFDYLSQAQNSLPDSDSWEEPSSP